MMYEELVKRLKMCAELHGECALCMYHGNGCDEMPETPLIQAADAIEALDKGYQMMAEAYEYEVTKPRWISVEERLPEKCGVYLVNIKDPFHYEYEDEEFFLTDTSYVTSAGYDNETGLWRESETSYYCANLSCVNTKQTYYISHWMPLPEPPKEES